MIAKCLRILIVKSLHVTGWVPFSLSNFLNSFGECLIYWLQDSLAANCLHCSDLIFPAWSLDSQGPHSYQLSRNGVLFLCVCVSSGDRIFPAKKLIFTDGQWAHGCSYDTLVTRLSAHVKVVLAPSWGCCFSKFCSQLLILQCKENILYCIYAVLYLNASFYARLY